MPNLLIRDVDEALHAALKARAAEHHRSLDEEVRVLLRAGLARTAGAPSGENLVQLAARLFGPDLADDLDIPPRDWGQDRAPPDFSQAGASE